MVTTGYKGSEDNWSMYSISFYPLEAGLGLGLI